LNKTQILPVILCGGSGTRLWPLSRKSLPKQFVPLVGGKSLLQATFERVSGISGKNPIWTVASEDHRFLVRDAADAAKVSFKSILEPVGRNTAAAMAAAALNAEPDHLLLFLPADHHVPDAVLFSKTVEQGVVAAEQGAFVTFGVAPTHPHTGYGYIQTSASLRGAESDAAIHENGSGSPRDFVARDDVSENKDLQSNAKTVQRFVEKPDQETALSYLASGDYYWNAGIFLVRADALIQALEQFASDILESTRKAVEAQRIDGDFIHLDASAFSTCRSESIDYAVLEPLSQNTSLREGAFSSSSSLRGAESDEAIHEGANGSPRTCSPRDDASSRLSEEAEGRRGNLGIYMVPFQGAWSDVGSWNAVAELTDADEDDNRIVGMGKAHQASATYIHAPHRPVVALGTEDLLIIDTTDAVLVAAKSHAEQVKNIVADLQQQNLPQATEHRHAARPWGEYDAIDEGDRFKVKRITVKPGASLSLQMHHHRAEHWIVVKGTARVTRDNKTFLLAENESTFIPVGTKHRLENPGTIPLEMIEVQSGSYLGEDDIERFDDHYGRAPVFELKKPDKK
jgi:mannose-1-phosphate guanylyltransferase/mannose-6-phosphate isomerase